MMFPEQMPDDVRQYIDDAKRYFPTQVYQGSVTLTLEVTDEDGSESTQDVRCLSLVLYDDMNHFDSEGERYVTVVVTPEGAMNFIIQLATGISQLREEARYEAAFKQLDAEKQHPSRSDDDD